MLVVEHQRRNQGERNVRPLSTARADRARYRRALAQREPAAVGSLVLTMVGFVLISAGFWFIRDAERSFIAFSVGLGAVISAHMLAERVRHGRSSPLDHLRFLTQGLFWFTLAVGLVILVNGRVPFLRDVLDKTPGQNVATDLGNALLGGLIVAAVLIVIELSQRRHDDRLQSDRQRESERSTMLLFLGLERDLSRVDLSMRDLSWFSLRRRDVSHARLRRSCLFRANLEHCDLTRTEFDDADLTNVFLADAVLTEAKLPRAVLDHAHLQRVRMAGAVLYGASLRAARLNDADLTGADLRAADLRGADLTGATLTGALVDEDTLWDAGLDAGARGVVVDNSPPRSDLVTPTGPTYCGSDHEDDRVAWSRQQHDAALAFRATLDQRISPSS